MEFFELVDISERYLELINPSSPEKVFTVGHFLRLDKNSRVIDFGCGYATMLTLWVRQFGISGVGVELRQSACERAREKLADHGISGRVEIVQARGAEYTFEEGAFDAATCIGATFIWDGFRPTLQALKRAVRPGGRLAVGEPYWLRDDVPAEYRAKRPDLKREAELLQIMREEGYDLEYVVRANCDDWDRYEASNWHGLVRWLEENPDHPERQDVITHLREDQDEYMTYGREFIGWAMYVLVPTPSA